MSYVKLNKKDGQILTEADLLHMEDGIFNVSNDIAEHLQNHPSAEHTHEEFNKLEKHLANHPSSEHIHEEFNKLEEHLANHPSAEHTHEEFDIVVYSDSANDTDIEIPIGNTGAYIGPNEPLDKSVIWFDTDDEEIDVMLSESEILDEFKHVLYNIKKNVDEADSILKYNLDCGYFLGREPGTTINTFSEIDPLIQYEGSWTIDNNEKHDMGSAKISNTPGDKCKFSFDGSGFKLYGLCSTNTGIVNVYIDGEKYEIDTYCNFEAFKQCYCNKLMLEDGVHTVVVEISDRKNFLSADCNVVIDKIEIVNGKLVNYEEVPEEEPNSPTKYEDSTNEDGKEESPFPNSTNNKYEGTIGALKLKRGYKTDIVNVNLQEGELAFCLDTEELYIGSKGTKKMIAKVGGSGSGGSGGSLTGKYVELESDNGKRFRISVNNDGELDVWDAAVDTAMSPTKDEASRFKGLIINHVYGGGNKNTNKSVVSHSYIELYNNSKITMNLKGLSIQYAGNNEEWKALPLRGIVKPNHSFLIRCSQVTDPSRPQVRHHIDKYDMHWEQDISCNGFKVYLTVGEKPSIYPNPFNINGAGMKEDGYIDLFAAGGKNPMFTIDACETSYIHAVDIDTSVHRIDFADTDKGFLDIEPINMKLAPSDIYKPRSTKYGKWDVHYNKLKLDEFIPMMINMCFGYDGNTSRTFTWQTKQSNPSYLQYKKKNSDTWITVECDRKTITHPDTDATVHSVIIHDLEPGFYEYRAGTEGRWTDVYVFEVKAPSDDDTIKFIQVGDQQGWNEYEYNAWKIISKIIEDREDFDFMINVGDISQNGGAKAFEWRYYYDMAKHSLYKRPHMTTVGNNDLTMDDAGKKTDPTAFTYYTTVENSDLISCYSFNLGYIHFICLNSNVFSADSKIMTDQLKWLKDDVKKPENKKRWTIVYMHESPYTQTRSSILVPFINAFAEAKVDLVLCGHHHRYSRSKRMGALGPNGENRQSDTGFYTVMGQATGYKLKGKTEEAPNNTEWMEVYSTNQIPMYIHWEVTYEKIKMNCYRVEDLIPYEENIGKTPKVVEFDKGFEITKPL